MNTSKKKYLLAFSLIFFIGCFPSYFKIYEEEREDVYKNFVQIINSIDINFSFKYLKYTIRKRIVSSGIIFYSDNKHSYILTVNHGLENINIDNIKNKFLKKNTIVDVDIKRNKLEVKDYYKKELTGVEVISVNKENDLGLLRINKLTRKIRNLKFAERNSKYERVYLVASPKGFYLEGSIPLYQGFYIGEAKSSSFNKQTNKENINFSFTSYFQLKTYQGSSGGVIINEKGEILSVVKGYYQSIREITVGPTLKQIKQFIHKNKIY